MGNPQEEATQFKNQGNDAFKKQDWPGALEFYTKAIEAYNKEPSFFTNRAQVRHHAVAHEQTFAHTRARHTSSLNNMVAPYKMRMPLLRLTQTWSRYSIPWPPSH